MREIRRAFHRALCDLMIMVSLLQWKKRIVIATMVNAAGTEGSIIVKVN
jgi:hypothetical protein